MNSGTRGTGNIIAAKQVIDMAQRIALLNPVKTPFVTLLKKMQQNTEVAENPKFRWMEDDIGARWDKNVGAVTNVATTMTVGDGTVFTKGDIVKNPRTGEVFLVNAEPAANVLGTIVRGYGVTAAAAMNDQDPLVIIGNVNAEGSGTRTIKTTTEQEVWNLTQIWKTPFGVTNTANASKFYGGQELSYQQGKKGIEHAVDIARSVWFGEKKEDLSGSQPQRSTAGMLSFMTQAYDATGQLTQSEFDNNVSEVIFKYGSKTKTMFCSARLLSVINGWAMGKLQVQQGEDTFGLAVFKYITPHGTYNLVPEPLFEGAVYGGYGAVLDLENIFWRPLKGRDTKLETNIQANDEDQRKDQYITEGGIMVKLPKTHFLLTGVTS